MKSIRKHLVLCWLLCICSFKRGKASLYKSVTFILPNELCEVKSNSYYRVKGIEVIYNSLFGSFTARCTRLCCTKSFGCIFICLTILKIIPHFIISAYFLFSFIQLKAKCNILLHLIFFI